MPIHVAACFLFLAIQYQAIKAAPKRMNTSERIASAEANDARSSSNAL